ncbi:MAG: hypothetical protein HY882_07930 [Deltaproteobacteria bacterium]|nr:hypothetical protein [Deltaproteobacteria bacterium]
MLSYVILNEHGSPRGGEENGGSDNRFFLGLLLFSSASAEICVDCHRKVTPNIVSDWQLSKHSKNNVDCSVCHGDLHQSERDVAKAEILAPGICATCHEVRMQQFKSGKHALGWAAMKAMPTIHWQPMATTEGMKGCGGCHKIGLKTYAYAFPDLLTFHDAPTVIEQKLFVMFLEHRMRTFQGAFHNNPDYTLWYGWSEMQRSLTEIKTMAKELRESHKKIKK